MYQHLHEVKYPINQVHFLFCFPYLKAGASWSDKLQAIQERRVSNKNAKMSHDIKARLIERLGY